MMFNFYSWGLWINIVEPLNVSKCRVRFLTYVSDDSKLNRGADSGLDMVELEDEEVVRKRAERNSFTILQTWKIFCKTRARHASFSFAHRRVHEIKNSHET